MDDVSCVCPLTAVSSLDDDTVATVARAQVCVICLLMLSCCWIGRAHWLQSVTWIKTWRRRFVGAWALAFGLSTTDSFTVKVEEIVTEAREKRCRVFLVLLVAYQLTRLLLAAVYLHVCGVWSQPDMPCLRDLVLQPHFNMNIVMVTGCVTVSFLPLPRRKVADMTHALAYMCGIVSLFFHRDVLEFTHDIMQHTVERLLFALFVGNTKLMCVLNLADVVAFVARVTLSVVLPQRLLDFCGVPLACLFVSCMVETYTRSEAMAHLKERSSRQIENTVQELLHLICDAVVFLDGNLNVKSPSPKFDDLLMRQAHPNELCGTSFVKHMHESCVSYFHKFVHESRSQAQSLHVDLHDHGGSRFAVQLFVATFDDALEQVHTIVGVLEVTSDHRPLPLSTTKGLKSCGGSDQLVTIKSCDESQVAVWVNVLQGALPIVSCSTSFTSVGGPMAQGESFLAWVKGDKSGFLLWVQTMVNTNNTIASRKVNLTPHNIEVRATCRICVEEPEDDEDDDSSDPSLRIGRIELTNIKVLHPGVPKFVSRAEPRADIPQFSGKRLSM